MKKFILTIAFCFSFALFFYTGLINSVLAQEKDSNSSSITIPTTISKETQNALINITTQTPEFVTPGPNDLKGWDEMNKQYSSMFITQSHSLTESFKPNITSTKFGDINVLDIKPKGWVDNGKVLVYVHGGGYTILGANSTLNNSVPVANATGLSYINRLLPCSLFKME